jgi:acetyl-CoA synthetase
MQKLRYTSLEEARNHFLWDEAWDLVDGSPESVNVTEECVDRHTGTAVRIKHNDGSTTKISFEHVSDEASRFANMLEDRGVSESDNVAVMLNPSLEFIVSFFGTLKRGATVVPCSELFGSQALEYRLRDSEVKLLISSADVTSSVDSEHLESTIERSELTDMLADYESTYEASTSGEDDAFIQYTSGTTGKPTPITFQHESIVQFSPVMELILDWQEEDSCFTTSSTGWGTGINMGLLAPTIFGVSAGFYAGKFDPDHVLDAIDEFDVNTLIGIVPTAFRKLVNAANDRRSELSVDKANYTGEPMDEDLSREIEDVFGAFPRSAYGVTEVRSMITIDYAYPDYEFRHGSMGKPLLGLEVMVFDEDDNRLPPGEVGYIAIKRSDEWIVTSDAGWCDEDGYFWSAGRMDDTIISAGYTIGPQEVEDALLSHPRIAEAGVIGAPDDERGEIVKAYISTTDSDESDATEDLTSSIREYVKDELGKHEYPREIERVDTVPTTPDGKVRRSELRKREDDG